MLLRPQQMLYYRRLKWKWNSEQILTMAYLLLAATNISLNSINWNVLWRDKRQKILDLSIIDTEKILFAYVFGNTLLMRRACL